MSLSQQRDRDGRTLLHQAAFDNDVQAARRLIAEGADVNAQDRAGYTPLHLAAQEYSIDVAAALLEGGARVDVVDKHGNTPLWTAVYNSRGRGQLILLLRDAGADPLHPNMSGRTPFDLARLIDNYNVEQYFEGTSDVNAGGTASDKEE